MPGIGIGLGVGMGVGRASPPPDDDGPPELLPSTDFSDVTGWTFDSGWSIVDGKLTAANAASGTNANSPVIATSPGTKFYRIEITVDSRSGNLRVVIGNKPLPNITAPGSYVYEATATNTGVIRIQSQSANLNAVISRFSIKEVPVGGDALLLESGDALLLESGEPILLED